MCTSQLVCRRAKSAISNDGCLYAVLEEAEGVSVSRMNCKLWRPRQVKDDEEVWGGEGFARLIFCGQYAWRVGYTQGI